MANRRKLKVVELYAGTARSSEPFRFWDVCEIALLVDNNQYAAETYLANFPGAPYWVRDLTSVTSRQIISRAGGPVDVLLGCPPCQGFSDNGNRDASDPRNRHLGLFGRFAAQLKPRAIVMENVPLAATSPEFGVFVQRIEEIGYNWTAGIINAALRGSCQCRQRLVYIAIRSDAGTPPVFPQPSHGGSGRYYSYRFGGMRKLDQDRNGMLGLTPGTFQSRGQLRYRESEPGRQPIPTVGEVLAGLPRIGTKKAELLGHVPWAHTRRQLRRMGDVPEGGRWQGSISYYSQSYGRLHRRGLARTITTAFPNAGSGRNWHPTANRSITLREAARLQGYPDKFRFLPPLSLAAFLVGNALDRALADLTRDVVKSCLS